ncbi:monoglyceride lipase-like [Tropilaelaps mercedesae]|uniref:Monoglyceride lipase-like n=1 Tax=Tropilaelaps mercedesae TaxID=418985 RepID=A0A1V9X8Z1_9ACAR|nr:monoglyceride lipase-like [Tropilaelaps mercedesae]
MGNRVSPRLEDVSLPAVEDSYELLSKDNNRKLWCKQWKPNNIEKPRALGCSVVDHVRFRIDAVDPNRLSLTWVMQTQFHNRLIASQDPHFAEKGV